jgi:hypothetical protein
VRTRLHIGELGFALIVLIGLGIGLHLAAFVLFGVSLFGVFYWIIPFVPAFLMALAHPKPHRAAARLRVN